MSKHNKPHICCSCQKVLDPSKDGVVYLGWGKRYDGKAGVGWVAALCAPKPSQMKSGSPCVDKARTWAKENGIEMVPSTYEEWKG